MHIVLYNNFSEYLFPALTLQLTFSDCPRIYDATDEEVEGDNSIKGELADFKSVIW